MRAEANMETVTKGDMLFAIVPVEQEFLRFRKYIRVEFAAARHNKTSSFFPIRTPAMVKSSKERRRVICSGEAHESVR